MAALSKRSHSYVSTNDEGQVKSRSESISPVKSPRSIYAKEHGDKSARSIVASNDNRDLLDLGLDKEAAPTRNKDDHRLNLPKKSSANSKN